MIEDLKKILEEKSLIFGFERTLKRLQNGKTKKIFLAKNISEHMKREILQYAKEVPIDHLDITNEEMGMLCKKPYKISVASI